MQPLGRSPWEYYGELIVRNNKKYVVVYFSFEKYVFSDVLISLLALINIIRFRSTCNFNYIYLPHSL